MRLVALSLALATSPALSQDQEIQRALIQRDQQSAEFAARVRGADVSRLERLHAEQLRDAGRPLHPDAHVARELQPYERGRMAAESARELTFSPPVVQARPAPETESRPLTLPSRTRTLVDPIPAQGLGY